MQHSRAKELVRFQSGYSMRRPCLFKERDVKRVLRAVLAMGLGVGDVKVDRNGTIIVVADEPKKANGQESKHNPWDEVLSNAENKKRTS